MMRGDSCTSTLASCCQTGVCMCVWGGGGDSCTYTSCCQTGVASCCQTGVGCGAVKEFWQPCITWCTPPPLSAHPGFEAAPFKLTRLLPPPLPSPLPHSPGGVNFEAAPFKLTRELLEIMDSNSEGKPSDLFDYFKVSLEGAGGYLTWLGVEVRVWTRTARASRRTTLTTSRSVWVRVDRTSALAGYGGGVRTGVQVPARASPRTSLTTSRSLPSPRCW